MNNAKYDLFISHRQDNGDILALNIKLLLLQLNTEISIFLDVDDLKNIQDLDINIRNSNNILLVITKGVFERFFVIEELKAALKYKKKIILIWDREHCPEFPKKEEVPEEIDSILLIKANIWSPEKIFRNVI